MIEELLWIFLDSLLADPAWQWVWILSLAITMYAFWFCKDRKFIYVMMIASIFRGVHFSLLWAFAAAWVQLFDIVKNSLALKYEKSKKIAIFCVISYIAIWLFTYENSYSLLPIISSIITVFLIFYVRWIWLNMWYLLIIMSWLWYNVHYWSIWWVSSDIILFFVWIWGVVRIILTEKKWKR